MNGSTLAVDAHRTVLVSGPSGAGKTSLIGQALKVDSMCPIYVMDFDLRLNSLLAVVPPERLSLLSYDQFRDTAVAPGKAFSLAEQKLRELADQFAKRDAAFKQGKPYEGELPRTVCLDSLTFCQMSVMNRVLTMDGKDPTSPPQKQHYLALMSAVQPFISRFTALPCNVIVTVHDMLKDDPITGASIISIDVTGKLAGRLPGYFNELWYAEPTIIKATEPPRYKLRTRPSNVHRTRTCFPQYLDVLEDQEQIWQKIEAVARGTMPLAVTA